MLVGRNRDNGRSVENAIAATGGTAQFVACDIARENSVRDLMAASVERFGKIDILFNNAGFFPPSVEVERLETEIWRDTFATNLDGLFFAVKYAKPYLLETRGVILNNASVAGMHSYAVGRAYAYSASKAAVIQFTRMMAKNYGSEGVRVNCICPGIVDTPMLHGRELKMYEERIPLGRVATPEDVAQAALFLVSGEAAYLTGVVLPVDGGASL